MVFEIESTLLKVWHKDQSLFVNHLLPEYKEIESKCLETFVAIGAALTSKDVIGGWVL